MASVLKMGLTLTVLAGIVVTLILALRKPVIRAVCKRNFLSYFSGVIGYLFILTFVVLSAFVAFGPSFFGANLANLDQLNKVFPILLLFIVPAITMSAWSDERKLGTDELLFTLPARDLEVVAGKYLAVLGVYTIALFFSMSLILVLFWLGRPDLGILATTYFGYWITGAALLSAGMVASVLTSSATVAYVLGSLICAVPVFIDQVAFGNRLVQGLSISEQFREFGLGLIPLGSLLFFVSFTIWMLYINLVLVSRRHWVGGPHNVMSVETKRVAWGLFIGLFTLYLIPVGYLLAPVLRDKFIDWEMSEMTANILAGLSLFGIWTVCMLSLLLIARFIFGVMGTHFMHRIIAFGLLLISANVVAANFNDRVDLTAERVYSLSSITTNVLKDINPDRPVRIQAFISPEVPREYSGVRSALIGMLRQFQQVGGRRVSLRIIDTDRFTPAENQAARYKIEPLVFESERAGRSSTDNIFMGVVVTAGTDDEVVIPFVDIGTPVEYELTTAIRTLLNAKRKKVGILRTDAKALAPPPSPFPMGPPGRDWRITTELKRHYDVIDVDPMTLKGVTGVEPGKRPFDVLLAIMPSSLTDRETDKLIEYIKSGGPTMLIDDPLPFFHTDLLPRQPKAPKPPTPQERMMGMPHGQSEPKADEGKATRLMGTLGVDWINDAVVWDPYDPHPDLTPRLMNGRLNIVYIGAKSGGSSPFSADSNITSNLQEVMAFFPGEIRLPENYLVPSKEKPGEKTAPSWFVPLLRTSPKTAVLKWDQYTRRHPLSGQLELTPANELDVTYKDAERIVAAQITKPVEPEEGASKEAKSKDKPVNMNVVLLVDLDMIDDQLFYVRDKQWHDLKLDNITFVMNALDHLAGDDDSVALRKRRAKHRTLEVVEQYAEQYKRAQADEDRRADKEARDELAERNKSFSEDVKKIEESKSLDTKTRIIQVLMAKSRQEQLRTQAEQEINARKDRRKNESKMEYERKVRQIENRVRTWALILLPLPVLLVGTIVFGLRLADEKQGANPKRIRH